MNLMVECKCCRDKARYKGAIDLNRTCHDRFGERVFDFSDTLINYYVCGNCGFIFTPDMDEWNICKFKEMIYNEEYSKADGALPGYENKDRRESVSYKNGIRLAAILDGSQEEIRVLDYGAGGNPGDTGLAFQDRGFDLVSFDPYVPSACEPPSGRFDFIYMIEVIEHCHNLDEVLLWVSKHLARDGIIHIETLLHGFPTPVDILSSWYIAPRNGHISIFTFQALAIIFRRYGINVVQTVFGIVGFKEKPKFPCKYFV